MEWSHLKEVGVVGLFAAFATAIVRICQMLFARYKPAEEVSLDTIKSLRETVNFEKARNDAHEARISALETALRDARVKEYQMLKILLNHLTRHPTCSETMRQELHAIGIAA